MALLAVTQTVAKEARAVVGDGEGLSSACNWPTLHVDPDPESFTKSTLPVTPYDLFAMQSSMCYSSARVRARARLRGSDVTLRV